MKENDQRLNALLRQWREVEPKANFEANVRRRIRLAQPEEPERVTLADWLRRLLSQPVFSMVAATVIAVFAGVWGGVRSVRKPVTAPQAELGFLGRGTLSGSYVTAVSEGAR